MESDGNETQNGATQTWCRKNAGRGRYRMGELRRNGAMGRALGCGRYRMGEARRNGATGKSGLRQQRKAMARRCAERCDGRAWMREARNGAT
jgi:hypothetical protein